MAIDLSLESRKIIRIRENISRYRVPKFRGSRKETVTIPLNTSVAQLHTITVRSYSLASRLESLMVRFTQNVKVCPLCFPDSLDYN